MWSYDTPDRPVQHSKTCPSEFFDPAVRTKRLTQQPDQDKKREQGADSEEDGDKDSFDHRSSFPGQ